MKCPKCGTVVPDSDNTCDFCGTDLTGARAQQQAAAQPVAAEPPVQPLQPGVIPSGAQAPGVAGAPGAPGAPVAAPSPALAPAPAPAPLSGGMKACAGCGNPFDLHAMKVIAGRLYCPGCEMRLVEMAAIGAEAGEGSPPGTIPCAGCGHAKGPNQLKEIGGGLYCVNCERRLVAALQGGEAGGAGAPAAAAKPKPRRPDTGDEPKVELTEEQIAEREERLRIAEEVRRKERERELAKRITSNLVKWPEVTLPPELVPPKDPKALRERPAPDIPEKKFANSGSTRLIWGPLALVFIGVSAIAVLTGTAAVLLTGFSVLGLIVSLYFVADSCGGLRVNTQGLWKDSPVAKKRCFWSTMKSVELIQEALPGLGFLSGFYSRLDLVITAGDGRRIVFAIGVMGDRAGLKDFEGFKRHFRMGAMANLIGITGKPGAAPTTPQDDSPPAADIG